MDPRITALLDKYNLSAFEGKFYLAGITNFQDLAQINRDTLRSYYCMLDADLVNFEKVRSECILTLRSSKRQTSNASGEVSSSIIQLLPSEPCGIGAQHAPEVIEQQNLSFQEINRESAGIVKSKMVTSCMIPRYNLHPESSFKGLGLVMIISNFVGGYSRPGAGEEIEKLKSLFTKMNFALTVEDYCSNQQTIISSIKSKFEYYSRLPSFFIAISSFGNENNEILCGDKQVISVSDIIANVSNIQSSKLLGKPKIILVQSIGIPGSNTEKKKVCHQTITKECDILVSFAYIPEFLVLNKDTGNHSWFIGTLCDAYDKLKEEETDFVSVLTYANHLMLKRFYEGEVNKRSIQIESTLTKQIIL